MSSTLFKNLVGQYVYVACGNYAYAGKLGAMDGGFVRIDDATVVYETGPWSSARWMTEEKLPTKSGVIVNVANVEMMFAVER